MRIGIRSLRELAQADLSLLLDEFGVIGQQLHDLANGIDRTNIREKYIPKDARLKKGSPMYDLFNTDFHEIYRKRDLKHMKGKFDEQLANEIRENISRDPTELENRTEGISVG